MSREEAGSRRAPGGWRTLTVMPHLLSLGALVAALLCADVVLAGQDKVPTLWEGVYTQAQALRGMQVFEERCAICHGSDLTGGDGPELVGGTFAVNWSSRYLDRLFVKVRDRMPPDDARSTTEQEKLDILAYVLERNGFPAGTAELVPDLERLASIQIVGKDGPKPPPTGAMVEVMGCLAGDGKAWTLTNATAPVVSTLDDPAADANAAAKHPLGNDTVTLLDVFPNPAQHKGHKMLAKGLLIRNNGMALNVLHLGLVGTTCTP